MFSLHDWKIATFACAGRTVSSRIVRILSLLALLSVASLLNTQTAQADYKFCNATSYVLDSAIGYETDTGWESQGWFRLLPGSCEAALPGKINYDTYYVFARSIDAHEGGTKYFDGSDRFCTTMGDFLVSGRNDCATRGFDSYDFTRVETRQGNDWTTTFSEPANFSLKRAEIAGAQRLLRDTGAAVSRIDGVSGRRTTAAVTSFQQSANLRANGKINSALFTSLIDRAEKRQAKSGLSFCNMSDFLVWGAVGYERAGNFVSSGWIRIEPQRCEKAIKGELTQQYYYAYAEAVDAVGLVARRRGQDLIWSGNHTFCTKGTRFEIEGREACAERGFDETGFKQIDTGDALVWTETMQ
ncbi:MAG: DUF1036 domain-containing protein [Parvibaculum sp.]